MDSSRRVVRAWVCRVQLIAVGVTLLTSMAHAERKSMSLNGSWEFRQRLEADGAVQQAWHPAEVPGVVQTDLLRNKLIPDPFFRSNESTLQWIENDAWEYRSTFQATAETLEHSHVELVFEGLDGPAEVYLNDKLIRTANNAFREWRVEVKSQLKAGANQLHVVFPSPIAEARKIAATDFWRQQTSTPEKSYLRKPAYEYGWDWGTTIRAERDLAPGETRRLG
jgi:beta-mannosidase